jgi:hypothetical protein
MSVAEKISAEIPIDFDQADQTLAEAREDLAVGRARKAFGLGLGVFREISTDRAPRRADDERADQVMEQAIEITVAAWRELPKSERPNNLTNLIAHLAFSADER